MNSNSSNSSNSNNSSNINNSKIIYLIRHGQSEFNQVYNNIQDPYLFDARLTKLGESQADDLSKVVEKYLDSVELIITSPLTRALETCKRSLGALISTKRIPCLVHSLHRELLTTSDDNGRAKSVLVQEYPDFDFTLVNEERWWIPEFCPELKSDLTIDTNEYFKKFPFRESESLFLQRVKEFKEYLLSRSESNIAVVGHGDFFYYLLNNDDMEDIQNCRIIKWDINNNESSYLNLN